MSYQANQETSLKKDDKPLSNSELLLLSASFSTLLGMVALVVGTS